MALAENCAKYILLGLNLVFFLVSLPLLGIGIWLKVDKSVLHQMLSMVKADGVVHSIQNVSLSLVDMLAVSLIVIGSITLIIGFCGCCGAMKENKILLYIYVFLVSFIVGLQLALIIVAIVKKEKLHRALESEFTTILIRDYNGIGSEKPTLFTKIFGALMIKMKCCGVSGIKDFEKFDSWKSLKNSTLENPIACCHFKPNLELGLKTEITEDFLINNMVTSECMTKKDSEHVNKGGCAEHLWEMISRKTKIVVGVLIGVMLLEVICIIFACCVINKSYEKLR